MTSSQIQDKAPRTVLLALLICALLTRPVASQIPPPDPRFGAVEAFRDPVAAAEAGVGWERILFYWSELQPGGPDDWNGYHVPNDWLAQAAAAGREVVAVLKHTPAWATDGSPGCGVPRGLDLPVDDPGNLWATFVRRVAGMYSGQINHWVIWNEPDIAPDVFGAEWCGTMEEYYQLLKVAYLAAHEANPNVTIHLAGLTYFHDITFDRPYYLDRLLAVASQDPAGPEHGYYFDVISLHIYFETKNFATVFGETRSVLATYGLQKPIWVNETNAPPSSDPPYWDLPDANFDITPQEQASFMLQAFALALSSGAERIAVYKWVDSEPQPGVEPFGIIRRDYSRRPAFDAYKLITAHYPGTAFAHEDRQSLYTIVTLDRGGLITRVLWARTEADVTVLLPALAAQARLIDQSGAEQTIEPADGQYTVALPRARCADKRGCIIGGPTYLLVEENVGTPRPTATGTPVPIEPPTAVVSPTDTPTPPPTATAPATPTPLPTVTPSPTPLPTSTPTLTSVPTPTRIPTSTPSPTATPWPSVPATPAPPAWPMLIGLAAVMIFAVLIGTLFKQRG